MTYFKQFRRRKTHVQCGWTPEQIKIALDFARQLKETGASENCYCLMIEGLIDGYMRSRFSPSTSGGYQVGNVPTAPFSTWAAGRGSD